MRRIGKFQALFLSFILCTALISVPRANTARAETAAEIERLKAEITTRNTRLTEIQKEIAQYQSDLLKVGSEKKTLQGAINQLELERKKISADISYTQNKIGSTDLEISKINLEINSTENDIRGNEDAIRQVLQRVDESSRETLLEVLLRNDDIFAFWGEIGALEQVRSVMSDEVKELASLKTQLEEKRDDGQVRRNSLVDLKGQYSDQQSILENNKVEKSKLLTQTKNKESSYQALLAEKRKAQEQMTKELRAFESQLQFILDPNTIPSPGTSVFAWPVHPVIITQYFGGTEFAKRNPGIYAGRAYHPGIDIGVPLGTKIYAPLGGVVRETGNTDAVPGCYSWGKWTLIDHPNGLSTLYAHQSLISVLPGQQVSTGDVIGYSGSTGYSTGPHLHFTVYAKAGVSIRKFSDIKTVTNCGPASTPVAAIDAYLDPILYLPPI